MRQPLIQPKVSQYYYPALAPIVQEVCEKHDVTYNLRGSLYQALALHVGRLVSMSSEPLEFTGQKEITCARALIDIDEKD